MSALFGFTVCEMGSLQQYLNAIVEDAKELRGKKKGDIAKALDISPQQLSNLLKGTNDWSTVLIERLCSTLSVQLFWPPDRKGDREELHRRLQIILDAGDEWEITIQTSINSLYKDVMSRSSSARTKESKKKAS